MERFHLSEELFSTVLRKGLAINISGSEPESPVKVLGMP